MNGNSMDINGKWLENKWKSEDIHEKLSKNDWLSLKCDSNLGFEMWIVTQNQFLSGEWSSWMNLWWFTAE